MIFLTADISAGARHWRNDKSVYRWCRQFDVIDEASHDKWLEKISNDPTIKMYGILGGNYVVSTQWWEIEEEPHQVGVCGLTSIDRVNQSAEFSLYIAPEHQRKGYGRHALVELLKRGFYAHNLNRIWGETFEGNPALKMFKSLGMKVEGTLRQSYYRDGHFIDSQIVSMLRSECLL